MAAFQRLTYICPKCGRTSEQTRVWKPCEKHSCYVCMDCCQKCECHTAFSGLHMCLFRTELQKVITRKKKLEQLSNQLNSRMRTDYAYANATYRVKIWEQLQDLQTALNRQNDIIDTKLKEREQAWSESKYIRRT